MLVPGSSEIGLAGHDLLGRLRGADEGHVDREEHHDHADDQDQVREVEWVKDGVALDHFSNAPSSRRT
jgi:hypothetical protein